MIGRRALLAPRFLVCLIVVAVLGILDAAPGHAESADEVFMALMEDGDGVQSIHQASTTRADCDEFLAEFKETTREGKAMWLTLTDPDYTGIVLEAYCIDPDGHIRGTKRR